MPRGLRTLRTVAQVPESLGATAEVFVSGLVRVESVRVSHLRGLTDCTLALQPGLTLLVGRNSSGKSRLLRAIALACGSAAASGDDFSVGSEAEPTIDLVLAPAAEGPDESFDPRVSAMFGQHVQPTSATGAQRIAWRTIVRRSAEGWGAELRAAFCAMTPVLPPGRYPRTLQR